jgi:hypothetical protein
MHPLGTSWAASAADPLPSLARAPAAGPRACGELILEGVTPTTLALTLCYHWRRRTALLYGLSEAPCEAWTADMGAIMRPLGTLRKRPVHFPAEPRVPSLW